MNREIVIVGFPKCGTTALMYELETRADVEVLTAPNGSLEYSWPLIKDGFAQPDASVVRAHKYTSYIYNDSALRFLASTLSNSIFVVCIRQSNRSLLSWHKMHMDLALSGRNKQHFAYKERDFYSTCSISDYYERFAKTRLRYDEYIEKLTSIVPPQKIVVVAQERLSSSLSGITAALVELASGSAYDEAAKMAAESIHVSQAEKSTLSVPADISAELRGMDTRLQDLIQHAGLMKFT